ncbi:MAG: hypothetical protein EOS03_23890 [Mesorhizobium sp.]|uniref:hypothetical protein n=1 Tax=Mesorhizobium sp. TaxID=1871066 RepID=UPI000FEA9BC3|nr:hypothetical protein [Mesorhizobium sp.]RWN44691.1 MAG: hypothetical protein EOS03_23890 [Mesorhizobium sp.]
MKIASSVRLDQLDEIEDAVWQKWQLIKVRAFLVNEEAEPDLVETIDIAIVDIDQWVDPEIERALLNGTLFGQA